MYEDYATAWEYQHAKWNQLGKSMEITVRELGNKEVAKIRGTLPFGPPSPQQVGKLAIELQLYPISVFRIWAGLTFKRSLAFPKDHPMKLNINAEQRERDQLRHLDIKAIGQAQDWKCVYCRVPLTGKHSPAAEGKRYHRDHIVPLSSGGLTEEANIQLTCSRCNQRKGTSQPNQQLATYMDRKVAQDRLFELCKKVVPPIAKSLIWADSLESSCPWCDIPASLVRKPDLPGSSSVFQCKICQRMFRASNFLGLEDLYNDLSNAMKDSWYYTEDIVKSIVEAIRAEDIPTARNLILERVGNVAEVRKRRHQHSKGGCWCEFGGDSYETISVFPQTKPF